jgi:hypothetical protein
LAVVQAARNFAIASSRVAAVPLVTPGVAGTIMIDQNQRMSGGVPALFVDAAHDLVIGEHVIVFVFPRAGRAGGGRALEDQRCH